MASLHLSLAALAIVTVPLALSLLAAFLGFSTDVHLGVMSWTLARTILMPLGLGLLCRAYFQTWPERMAPVLVALGRRGVLLVLVLLLVASHRALLAMDGWSYMVIAVANVVALSLGHVFGPANPREKTALAVECAVRHPTLALTIGAANFGPERAVSVLLPCLFTSAFIALAYMAIRQRVTARTFSQSAAR